MLKLLLVLVVLFMFTSPTSLATTAHPGDNNNKSIRLPTVPLRFPYKSTSTLYHYNHDGHMGNISSTEVPTVLAAFILLEQLRTITAKWRKKQAVTPSTPVANSCEQTAAAQPSEKKPATELQQQESSCKKDTLLCSIVQHQQAEIDKLKIELAASQARITELLQEQKQWAALHANKCVPETIYINDFKVKDDTTAPLGQLTTSSTSVAKTINEDNINYDVGVLATHSQGASLADAAILVVPAVTDEFDAPDQLPEALPTTDFNQVDGEDELHHPFVPDRLPEAGKWGKDNNGPLITQEQLLDVLDRIPEALLLMTDLTQAGMWERDEVIYHIDARNWLPEARDPLPVTDLTQAGMWSRDELRNLTTGLNRGQMW